MRVCIVAGGTGGHIAPALAVAEKITDEKIFVTGRSRAAERKFVEILSDQKIPLEFIDVKPIVGRGMRTVAGFLSAFSALAEALRLIKKINPDVVIGFGGYVSGPVCLAAKLLGKKVFVHEQNSVMGFANSLISIFCDGVFTSFERTEVPRFALRKLRYVGFPLRNRFKEDLQRGLEEKNRVGETENVVILVSGGSQGALGLNKLVVETLRRFESFSLTLRRELKIFHQTGDVFFREAENFYGGVWNAKVFPFSESLGFFIGLSDLVIARGGAGTVFEVAYARKPTIFVPLPRSAGGHQEKNPQYLLGDTCLIVKQNERYRFETNLFEILTNRQILENMKRKMMRVHVEDGSFRILRAIRESG